METFEKKFNTKGYKITIGILSAVIVVLSILLIITKTKVNTFIVEKEAAINERQVLQSQLDSLLNEHEKMKEEYGSLTSDLILKDSVIQAQAGEIQKLIESNAGKRQIQRKLDYLRGITQDYVAQIDKLLKENENLKTEIKGMAENIKTEQEKAINLQKDKEDLKEQLDNAAVLSAYSVKAYGVDMKGKREETTDKARKADKIKISFTIGKNPLVGPGLKKIYVRIACPDNQILNTGQSFQYQGSDIMYSLQETINYQNKPVEIALYYERSDRIVPGKYNVSVFSDGFEIGETDMILK